MACGISGRGAGTARRKGVQAVQAAVGARGRRGPTFEEPTDETRTRCRKRRRGGLRRATRGYAGLRGAARATRGRRDGGVAVARRRGSGGAGAGARASLYDLSVRPAAYSKAGTTKKKKSIQYPRLRHGVRVVAAVLRLCGCRGARWMILRARDRRARAAGPNILAVKLRGVVVEDG